MRHNSSFLLQNSPRVLQAARCYAFFQNITVFSKADPGALVAK